MSTEPREYFTGLDPMSIMDYSRDDLKELRGSLESTITTLNGLIAGDLQYDMRSAMIVAQLIGGMREKIEECIASIALNILHAEEPPATNAIARAVGVSVTKLKSMDAAAVPWVPEEEDAE